MRPRWAICILLLGVELTPEKRSLVQLQGPQEKGCASRSLDLPTFQYASCNVTREAGGALRTP